MDKATDLEEKNGKLSSINRIADDSGPRAFYEKKSIGNATKGL